MIQNYLNKRWLYPLVLLAVCLASYGLQITRLGFYWDDWQVVFLSRLDQAGIYWDYFFSDRPLSAWTYVLSVPLLGMKPLVWQLFTLLVRWLSVLGFCWALHGIWPGRVWQIRWMGLLLAVFPGFSQQSVSVAYSQHFLSYALFTFSLGLMVWAVRRPERFWLFTSLALLFSLLNLATMEYFFGLELLRPLLLWLLLRREGEKAGQRLWKTLMRWLPYLGVLIAFLGWRFVVYPRLLAAPDENAPLLLYILDDAPLPTLIHLAQLFLQDAVHMLLFVWANTIGPETIELEARATLFSWAVGLLAGGLSGWYLWRAQKTQSAAGSDDGYFSQALVIGGLAVLLGGLPVWITDRQAIVGLWSDRFTLAPMLGVVILLVWLVEWLVRERGRATLLLSLLLGFSIAAQIRTVNKYRLNWEIQRDYYWQLSWRAPALKPGTAIVSPKMPFGYVGDYSVGFALNALYAGRLDSTRAPYWFINAGRLLGTNVLPRNRPGQPVYYPMRNVVFESSTDQTLAVSFNPSQGCVRVLDEIYRGAPRLSGGEDSLIVLSNLDQIIAEAALPPDEIFGEEPPHEWCYYFEKADLERQQQDWEDVAALGDQAAELGLRPRTSAEWVPFILGYAHLERWDEAARLTLEAEGLTEGSEPYLCFVWEQIDKETPDSPQQDQAVERTRAELECDRQ